MRVRIDARTPSVSEGGNHLKAIAAAGDGDEAWLDQMDPTDRSSLADLYPKPVFVSFKYLGQSYPSRRMKACPRRPNLIHRSAENEGVSIRNSRNALRSPFSSERSKQFQSSKRRMDPSWRRSVKKRKTKTVEAYRSQSMRAIPTRPGARALLSSAVSDRSYQPSTSGCAPSRLLVSPGWR